MSTMVHLGFRSEEKSWSGHTHLHDRISLRNQWLFQWRECRATVPSLRSLPIPKSLYSSQLLYFIWLLPHIAALEPQSAYVISLIRYIDLFLPPYVTFWPNARYTNKLSSAIFVVAGFMNTRRRSKGQCVLATDPRFKRELRSHRCLTRLLWEQGLRHQDDKGRYTF